MRTWATVQLKYSALVSAMRKEERGKREGEDELTVARPEGQGSPLQRSEPKPRAAIDDIQAHRGLTRQYLQLSYFWSH